MVPHILAVDDDPEILEMLLRVLSREGMEVEKARSAQEALVSLTDHTPDILILDINMPGMDGLTLCRRLRQDTRFVALPILFLTALGKTDDIVKGLDAGADDYIVKPFKGAELMARVRALLRRARRTDLEDGAVLEVGQIRLDSATYQAFVQDKAVQLTATEHRLLRYLMEHANQPISTQHLLEAVWEYPSSVGNPDLVRAHVRNLRCKLEAETQGSGAHYIRTVHGVGYMVQS